MKISIIGTGYVGLVTGACFADRGHDVTCVDVDLAKVEQINLARAPIHEDGLPELLKRQVGVHLSATTELKAAVMGSDITFIAVNTPAAEGRIDLQYVEAAAEQVGTALRAKSDWHVVVVKSTVVPGTTDTVVRQALERSSGKRAGVGFGLGVNPEFLTEGTAIADFTNPDRIVVGGIDARTHGVLRSVYASFLDVPVIETNCATAEMIKYASNSVLATLISFSNELSRLCDAVGNIDIADVMAGVHEASYFTKRMPDGNRVRAPITSFLEAGCGFGGSCLPKDVTALSAHGESLGVEVPMLRSVLAVNRGQPAELLKLITRHYPSLAGLRVTVLGLAFKPDTDDLRESPAFPIIGMLRARGAVVTAYDPVARPKGHSALKDVVLADSLRNAVADAAVVVLVTRWPEFQDLARTLNELERTPLVVDGRRVLAPRDFAHYEGIGRRMLAREETGS